VKYLVFLGCADFFVLATTPLEREVVLGTCGRDCQLLSDSELSLLANSSSSQSFVVATSVHILEGSE